MDVVYFQTEPNFCIRVTIHMKARLLPTLLKIIAWSKCKIGGKEKLPLEVEKEKAFYNELLWANLPKMF